MADETIILTVQADGYETIARASQEMRELKKAAAALQKDLDAGKISMEDYAKKMAVNAAEQDKTKKAIRETTAELKQSTAITNEAKGSINQMRAELSLLTKQYNAMSAAERNSAGGEALKTKIAGLSTELKALEGGVGNFTRNVGDYTNSVLEGLQKVFPEVGLLKGALEGLTSVQQTLTTLVGQTTKAQTTATVATEVQTVATEAQTVANEGMAASTVIAAKGFDLLKVSLLSNPITLVVVALVSLLTYLSQFDGAMDSLKAGWAGATAAAKPLINIIGQLGSMLFDIINIAITPLTTSIKAMAKVISGDLSGAWDSIKQGATDVVSTSVGLAKKTDDLTSSMNGLVGAMDSAARAAYALEKANQDLEDSQGLLAVKTVVQMKAIEQAEKAADDRSKTKAERLANLNEAQARALALGKEQAELDSKASELAVKNTLKLAGLKASYWADDQKFTAAQIANWANVLKRLSDEGKLQGDLNEHLKTLAESAQKQLDAEQKAKDITLDYAAKSGKLRAGIQAEEEAAAKAATEARKKSLEDRLKLEAEYRAQMRKLAELEEATAPDGPEKMRAKQQLLAMQMQEDIKAAGENAELKKAIRAKYNQDVENLEANYRANQATELEAWDEDRKAKEKQAQDDRISALDEYYKRAGLVIAQSREIGLTTEAEANLQQLELQAEHLEALAQLQADAGQSTIDTEIQLSQTRLAIQQRENQESEKLYHAQVTVAKNAVNSIASLGTILMGNSAQAQEFQKGLALVQIGIDTASAISGIVRIASTTSPDPITFGIQLSAGIATVLANIAKATELLSSSGSAEAPQLQKARDGGVIGGRLHAAGGTVIEAEAGERIMTRGAQAMFGSQLAMLNAAGGGQGMAATVDAARVQEQLAINQEYAMTKAAAAMPAPIVTVQDIARTQTDASRVVNKATI